MKSMSQVRRLRPGMAFLLAALIASACQPEPLPEPQGRPQWPLASAIGELPDCDPRGTPLSTLGLSNGGFEQVDEAGLPLGWSLHTETEAAGSLAVDRQHVYSGDASLRLEQPDSSSTLARSALSPTYPGAQHMAAALVQNHTGVGALALEFWDAEGNRLEAVEAQASTQSQWQHVTVSAASPSATVAASVAVLLTDKQAGAALFDEVQLARETGAVDVSQANTFLFADSSQIGSVEHASVEVQPALKCPQPVLVTEHPWEIDTGTRRYSIFMFSVIFDRDEQIYKMWYGTLRGPRDGDNVKPNEVRTMYATSANGLEWTKPIVGLIEYEGSRENNIVLETTVGTVIKDYAETDPARRYKAFTGLTTAEGYAAYFSPDGLRWTPFEGNPIFVVPGGDTAMAFYDEAHGRFTAVLKVQTEARGFQRRSFAVAHSQDFIEWTEPRLVLETDERDDQLARGQQFALADFYAVSVMPVANMYVGFPVIFQQLAAPGEPGANDGPFDVQMAFSQDLITWDRQDRRNVLQRGPGGSFDTGLYFLAPRPLVVGNEVWLYFAGMDGLHLTPLRQGYGAIARWRINGFASMSNGGHRLGVITTEPLMVSGGELSINGDVRGSLRVEVLDTNGNVLPGFDQAASLAIAGNDVSLPARWLQQPSLTSLVGSRVRLRFYLDDGDLFSFHFNSTVP